jgi:hypothetical protein
VIERSRNATSTEAMTTEHSSVEGQVGGEQPERGGGSDDLEDEHGGRYAVGERDDADGLRVEDR